MKRIALLIPGIFLMTLYGYAQRADSFFKKADSFFATYVKDGRVKYKTLKADTAPLEELMEIAAHTSVSTDDPKTYQAFWINAYNLAVIQGIVDSYPVKSPLDIPGFFDVKKFSLGGTSTTLNDIENKLLRAKFPDEARFHFVLVCAGLGCPPIINSAYTPSLLETQLERQTKIALNDPKFIRVSKKKVAISQLFDWYKEDFVRNRPDITAYINTYRDEKLPEDAKISFYDYDWSLNE